MAVSISVIICTEDQAESLRQTLLSLCSEIGVAPESIEVLVIDNSSRDDGPCSRGKYAGIIATEIVALPLPLLLLVRVGHPPVAVHAVTTPVVVSPQASYARSGGRTAQCGQKVDEWRQAGGHSDHRTRQHLRNRCRLSRLVPAVACDISRFSTTGPPAPSIEPRCHLRGEASSGSCWSQEGPNGPTSPDQT